MTRTVKIGPQFFAKAKNDYADWRFAIARELEQNSIDARARNITIDLKLDGDDTLLTYEDDGRGMTEEVLTEKLLALGESGKDFAGTVGGFGKAKEILYFCHKAFAIETRDNHVSGSGGTYDLTRCPYVDGCRSTIRIEGDHVDALVKQFKRAISMTQWGGRFTLNGEVLYGQLKKGAFRKELDWCKIYTNKTFANRLVVRIGGIVMFTKYVEADDRCVIVELKGNSSDVLQSSRDHLKWDQSVELDELIRKLTVDKNSAFRSDHTYYTHYEGEKLENRDQTCLPEIKKMQDEIKQMANEAPVIDEADNTPTLERDAAPILSVARCAQSEEAARRYEIINSFRHDFVLRNDSGMQIPDYYKPGQFSAYSDKLVNAWVKLLMECYRTFGRVETFSVGFCFDDAEDTWAMFERSSDYGRVFYINPAKVVKTSTGVRVFAKRWGFTPNMKYNLIVTAVHEFVHSLGFSYHDERYVQELDKCSAVVMKNLKRFRACFA